MLVYLTCAARRAEARAVDAGQIEPGERELLGLLDGELALAGFRHLGWWRIAPLLTYYCEPVGVHVFAHERLPCYALVSRQTAPEYGRLVAVELRTTLASGEQLVTRNTPLPSAFISPSWRDETLPGASVQEITDRHSARLVGIVATPALHFGLDELHSLFRARRWIAPTSNPSLDRFTPRGALALSRPSRAVLGVVRAPFEGEQRLRVEAELCGVMSVAEHPEQAPGTAWPLLALVAASAVLSFLAMMALWNAPVAALILAAVALHEGGHALVMRRLGYRDVNIFFVPLLGAMTVGRPVAASVRDRMLVLLAGPLPGLWLAVGLLAIDPLSRWLRAGALALLFLNGLNLLPFTPLDGGRALELLSRPESLLRPLVHALSAAGLLGAAAHLSDPVIGVLGAAWLMLLPRQLELYRLRRAVAARVRNRADFREVARAALEIMLTAPKWPSAARQALARRTARLFTESAATPGDRWWGLTAYAAAWIPIAAAYLLWH